MPDDPNYSVEEDQANPVDLTGLGMSPVQPTPSPMSPVQATPAPPNPGDQLTQRILAQLNTSPESIYQDKLKEYYHDLGVTPGTKKAKIASFLSELTKNYQSTGQHLQQDRENGWYTAPNNPKAETYKPLNQRLRDSAQSEYEKTYALQKGEAETLAKDLRAEERAKAQLGVAGINANSRENVQKLKNYSFKQGLDTKEKIEAAKNEVARILADSTKSLKEKQGALAEAHTKLSSAEFENSEHLKGLPVDLQNELGSYILEQKLGPEYAGAMRRAYQANKSAGQKPSDTGAYYGALPEEESANAMDKYRQLQKNKNTGNRASGIQVFQKGGMIADAEGNVTEVPTFVDKDTVRSGGGMQQLPMGGQGRQQLPSGGPSSGIPGIPSPEQSQTAQQNLLLNNADTVKRAKAFERGGVQGRASLGTMLSAIQNKQEGGFTGALQGNELSKTLREYELLGERGPYESMKDILSKNGALMHASGMMGGGRLAYQMADNMEKVTGAHGATGPHSFIYGMGGLVYSMELGKLENMRLVNRDEVTNTLMARVHNELVRVTNQAYADQKSGKHTEIKMKSMRQLVEEDRASKKSKPKVDPATSTADSRLDEKLGIGQ